MLIRIHVVDARDLVRRGLVALLEAAVDLDVVGTSSTTSTAVADLRRSRPDAAVVGLREHDGHAIHLARELAHTDPPIPCLLLSGSSASERAVEVTLAHAAGAVARDADAETLQDAVRDIARGRDLLGGATRALVERQLVELARDVPPLDGSSIASAGPALSAHEHERLLRMWRTVTGGHRNEGLV